MDIPKDDTYSVLPMPEDRRSPAKGRVLCFAPHPDDECAGPGGALRLHRRQGDPVRIVIATDGRAGDPDEMYDPATYPELRRRESREAMAKLDCEDIAFWGLPDSCVITDADIEMLAERVAEEIRAFQPSLIYTPWEGEANSDHRAIYCGALRGMRKADFRGEALGYELWGLMVPDVVLDITAVADEKFEAMRSYKSQLAYVDYMHSVSGQNAHRSVIFNRGIGYAEAFRRVRVHAG